MFLYCLAGELFQGDYSGYRVALWSAVGKASFRSEKKVYSPQLPYSIWKRFERINHKTCKSRQMILIIAYFFWVVSGSHLKLHYQSLFYYPEPFLFISTSSKFAQNLCKGLCSDLVWLVAAATSVAESQFGLA